MRIRVIAVGAAALAVASMVACGSEHVASDGATSRARTAVVSATCNQAPWSGVGAPCTMPRVVTGPITCDDLDLAHRDGRDLRFGPADFDGENDIHFEFKPGFFTIAYEGRFGSDGSIGWAVSSNYDHDGDTRTFDAVILSGATDAEASSVFVFDEPQFDVRDLIEASTTRRLQICNYRPARTPTLPPSPGASILCGIPQADGSLGDPRGPGLGTLVTSTSELRYELRLLSPHAPDGTPVTLHAKLDGVALSDAAPTLHGDRVVGTYQDPALEGASGEVEIRMEYGGTECGIWFELQPPHAGGGGQTW